MMKDRMISPDELFDPDADFNDLAFRIFHYQFLNNPVYHAFCTYLKRTPETITDFRDIPFLPVEFFKNHEVYCGNTPPEKVFLSSGTTGMSVSRHFVADLSLYRSSWLNGFRLVYGDPQEYCILALLPGYLERTGSSLINMVQGLMNESSHPLNGFFLHNHQDLSETLSALKQSDQKTMLIGVSYALLDYTGRFPLHFPELIVVETGGMKGQRKEIVREELHNRIKIRLGIDNIHSEYGMTELLSQGWSTGNGRFTCPPWMKICIHDTNDPLTLLEPGSRGGINIIDLANLYSCSFLATSDLGVVFRDGSFEVLGRYDHSDIRGCNLMAGSN